MGEVGVNTADSPSSSIKENGEINGNCNDESEDVVSKKVHEEIGSDVDDESSQNNEDTNDSTKKLPDIQDIPDDPMETEEKDDIDGDGDIEKEVHNGDDPFGNVHQLSDSDDDSKSKSSFKNIEAMEVDVDVDLPANGHNIKSDDEVDDEEDSSESDADKPVSINSDSEIEEDSMKPEMNCLKIEVNASVEGLSKLNDISNSSKSNGDGKTNGDCNNDDVHEILSDKEEDCVVVEDDKKTEEIVSPRRSSRQRKSIVKVRDFSAFDDDDDIEEIIDDPLSISANQKKLRQTLTINQSIQQNSFRNQLSSTPIQKSPFLNNSNNKEPTLVIIDTNTLINNARNNNTSINLTTNHSTPKSQNSFSVLPMGMSQSNLFNTSRNALLNQSQSMIPKAAPPPLQPVAHLLPALTDDMFVLEAPSFIVPYIYEKPPADSLKDIVTEMEAQIKEMRKKLAEEEKNEDETSQESLSADAKVKKDEEAASKSADEVKTEEKKKKKKRKNPEDDDDWDEFDTSTDDEASDGDERTKVLIKEVKEDIDTIKEHIITPESAKVTTEVPADPAKKSENYFENPLGKFFMNIGVNLVQEYVQTDLLRQQKRKKDREGKQSASTLMAINSLMKNLELSKENNEPFKFAVKRCEYCSFKSESALAMAHHYETPHMRNYVYKCNFCSYETRPPHDILYHMEAVHNIKGKLEKGAAYHQCPNCPFEDNGKSKLARHTIACAKKFRPEINLNPPLDWEPPAKIPRIKPKHGLVGTATAYQAMAAQQQRNILPQRQGNNMNNISISNLSAAAQAAALRARGRPQTITTSSPAGTVLRGQPQLKPNMGSGMVIPNYQLAASAIANSGKQFISVGSSGRSMLSNSNSSVTIQNSTGIKIAKPAQQPSISITPLPRQSAQSSSGLSVSGALSKIQQGSSQIKPGQNPNATGKTSFVVCEICDGYIKDLDQLRNHMQWIHKVKIHPKMIYNRPPLNCQKCQYRFFTDQGLERHLLGSHGLVTSSMQEAANKGKDAGRCPVCGRVYQWKLLNHVSRDHNMTLKPAHLSYKCTVCTATFGMYKQFESHVYSAHSTVAKKALDNKNKNQGGSANKSGGDSLLKPLKINDEITIIPQPTSKLSKNSSMEIESHVID